jgi:ubiquinone/menaquinone biosynthesis C-methylase UbiE
VEQSRDEVLEYWDRAGVESMYDKRLLDAEIRLIRKRLTPRSKILDAGCGEGEGTLSYSSVEGATIYGVDFSDTRLKLAAERLADHPNVQLKKCDFRDQVALDSDFDFVISQRFLINLMEWELQQRVLDTLLARLKRGGKLILVEGSVQGVAKLNAFREVLGFDAIPIKWHNLFLDDEALTEFMSQRHCRLVDTDGLGTYFLLTRGVRPVFDKELNWDSDFNRQAASEAMTDLLGPNVAFSRLKLWMFEKT